MAHSGWPARDRRKNYEGKIVTTLNYCENNAEVFIPVRLVSNNRKVEMSGKPYRGKGSKPTHTKACVFRVYLEEVGLKPSREGLKHIECTDIEVLRAEVMGRLSKKHELDWEDWFLVTVGAGYEHDLNSISVAVNWERVYIATLPDGTMVHQMSAYGSDRIETGLPDTWAPGEGKGRRDGSQSLIVATEENEAALGTFKERLSLLRSAMMEFLSPKTIKKNLASIAERLLPEITELKKE